MNPFVFIVGCPRSGTTLLQRLVDAHPQLAIIHETLWIPRFFERRVGLTPDGLVTPALVPRLLEHRRFGQLGVGLDDLEGLIAEKESLAYSDFVSALFDHYGREHGKELVGDKSPGYVRSIPTLHELWPRAKFVHLIRDGRDVCLSAVNWKKADRVLQDFRSWPADRVTTAAFWWERSVRLGREAGRALPPGLYCEVLYEALVADPWKECQRLCEFLNVPCDDAMLRFHEGRTRAEQGLSSKRKWLPPTSGLRDWRTQMAGGDVERFEAAVGDLLGDLGYGRGAVRPEQIEYAERLRRMFIEDVRARGRPLPELWAA